MGKVVDTISKQARRAKEAAKARMAGEKPCFNKCGNAGFKPTRMADGKWRHLCLNCRSSMGIKPPVNMLAEQRKQEERRRSIEQDEAIRENVRRDLAKQRLERREGEKQRKLAQENQARAKAEERSHYGYMDQED